VETETAAPSGLAVVSPGGRGEAAMPDSTVIVRDAKSPLLRLQQYLERLVADGFYGKIVLSLQNGKISDVRIEQTKKLDEL
jgi:hypothetical protein